VQVHTALLLLHLLRDMGTCAIMLRQKTILAAPNLAYIGSSSSNFTVQHYIPSTSGDALSAHIKSQEMSDLGSETLICNISEFSQ
jgi:hypothetical protein